MHLSLLSDSFVSDSLKDSVPTRFASECDFGADDHLRGLLRGLLFAAALSIPLGLTALSAWFVHNAAGGPHAYSSRSATQPGWVANED